MTEFPSYPRLCPYEVASEELVALMVRQSVGRVRVVDIQRLGHACIASVYRVVLSASPWQVAVRLGQPRLARRDVSARTLAWAAGVPVPRTLWFGLAREGLAATVLEWVALPTLRHAAPTLSECGLRQVGRGLGLALARLHLIGGTYHGDLPTDAGDPHYPSWLAWALGLVERLRAYRRVWSFLDHEGFNRVTARLVTLGQCRQFRQDPLVLLHGDLSADNLLVNVSSSSVVLIDFDGSYYGVPILEMPKARKHVLHPAPEMLAGFHQTYASRDSCLSNTDWELLRLLVRFPSAVKLLKTYDPTSAFHCQKLQAFAVEWRAVTELLPP